MPSVICKICDNPADFYGKTQVLKKYHVGYFRCGACGFIQTEDPFWLDEAYTRTINESDVGILARNKQLVDISMALLNLFYNRRGRFLDYGGGYGIFVRMMRDRGFNFYWYDRYCENLFAKTYEVVNVESGSFELLTSFELFEHLADPREEVSRMRRYADNIFFTTMLLPPGNPKLEEWWYFGREHGQHISFFTRKSLEIVAEKLALKLVSNNTSIHLFTTRTISNTLFSLITQKTLLVLLLNKIYRNKSLTAADYNEAVTRMLAE